MKLSVLAINCLLFLTGTATAQYVPRLSEYASEYATQCGPGGCPPQYSQPRQQRQRPQPDGVFTPPVGAPGTPDFRPCPPPINPPAPLPVVQPTTPALPTTPPMPTIDPKAKAEQEKQIRELRERYERIEKSLVIIEKQGGCKCQPANLTVVENQLQVIAKGQLAILEKFKEQPKIQQPAPAPVASGAPVFYDIRPHRSN